MFCLEEASFGNPSVCLRKIKFYCRILKYDTKPEKYQQDQSLTS